MKKSIFLILLACLLCLAVTAESGDLNGDGQETLLDVLLALRYTCADTGVDMNGDGNANVQDVLLLLRRFLNSPEPLGMTDVSKDMQFLARNCSWSYNDGVLTLNSVSQGGDGFAMSSIYVPGGTAFAFEATMQVTEGNKCGGLTFGVRAPERPEVMWYCVNVDHTGKRTRLFSVGTGTVGTSSTAPRRALTEEELAMDTYTVRIEVTEGGKISWWMNGEFVASAMEENFAGGYLGFNAFKSRVVFSDISVRIGESALPVAESITAVNGNWNFEGGTLTGTNSSVGDRFAMTDVFVPAGKAFTVETTATLLGGSNTGGIVFGVPNPKSPASAWYCANVSKKSARLFSVKTGSLGTGSGTTVALPAAENYKTDHRLRLTGSADGTLAYYVDDVLVFERQDTTFAGGYIGFNTYKSYVSFKDIVVTVDGEVQPLANALLTTADTQVALRADAAYQSASVPATANEVTVKLPIPKGYTARVGTELVEDGKYTFAPAYGKNKVQIDLRDKYARKTTMVLEVMRDIPAEQIYKDTYRPLLHVTPPKNFMNDPNGLHYNAATGEYHTYYQWNPTQMRIGNQVWGHAVSKDLLHWTDHGIAIDRPADGDAIFSGCAVIDRDNTSGLFDESVAPDNRVVAIYTITGPFRQELAYSTDGGYTFTKYEGNPVIASSNYFASFRDPKIQWIEEKQLWLLVIAGGPMELYTSPDLIHWTSQGTMKYLDGTTIESECPMLLALPLDGDENNIKYVYVGSGRFYVVGDLVWDGDSVKFVAEQTKTATVFYSSPHYASQNFYNDAHGRTLVMNWMQDLVSGSLLDEKYWNGVQSLPYETTLVTENGRMVLHFAPIAELEDAKGDTLCAFTDVTLTDDALDTETVSAVYGILDMKAKLSEGATLTLGLREGEGYKTTFTFACGTANSVTVTMDTKASGPIARTTKTATVTTDANGYFGIKTVLDNVVLEAFTSDGKVFADTIFPPVTADGISLAATGTAHIQEFVLYAIEENEEMYDYSYTDIVDRMLDTEVLSVSARGEKTGMFSSYDRTSQYSDGAYTGWRANNDGGNVLGETEDGGQLLADITGAGYISRIWSATSGPGHVKIIVDGKTVIDLPFTDYFNGNSAPFDYENLVYEDAARGKNNYVPITFAKSCRVVAYGGFGDTGWGKYYHINYTLFPEGTTVESMPMSLNPVQRAALESVNTFMGGSLGTHPDGVADAAFETAVVSKDSPFFKTLTGKGAISGLLARVALPDAVKDNEIEAIQALKDLRIRIYWDGAKTPFVDAPLGDFFASGYGFDAAKTLLVGVRDDRTLYNYYYMPYTEQAKIEIFTVGEAYTVSLAVHTVENTVAEEDMLYFGAQFDLGEYHPDALVDGVYDATAPRSPDYRFLKINGAGRFVGLNLHLYKAIGGADPVSNPGQYWWGEGDEKFFVDGEKFPSWYGTGTEDFFGYAWGDSSLFSKAYHAQSYCVGGLNGVGNRMQTRILLGDSVPFAESFEGYLEKYYTDAYVRYGFTSYFYATRDSKVEGARYDADAVLEYYTPEIAAYRTFMEGETLEVLSVSGEGASLSTQEMSSFSPAWSGNTQLLFKGFSEGASATLRLPAPADGDYVLLASFATASDFATLQISVNGSAVGAPIDTYGETVAADVLTEVGTVSLQRGHANTLTVTGAGKNAASKGYFAGLDFILLVPAEEYNGLSGVDLSHYTNVPRLNVKRDVTIPSVYTFEGEGELLSHAWGTAGTVSVQTMAHFGTAWSGNAQLLWKNTGTANASMRAFLWVEEAGAYTLTGGFTTAVDFGKFTVTVNGKAVGGTMDFYSKSVSYTDVDFGTVTLKAGYNKLVFKNTGKNESSTGYLLGIDCLQAEKVQ